MAQVHNCITRKINIFFKNQETFIMKPKTEQLNKSLMVKSGFTTFSKKKEKESDKHTKIEKHTLEKFCVFTYKN